MVASLTVLSGSAAGTKFTLANPEGTIGRDERNDVAIDDRWLSRRHARIRVDAAARRVWLEDLDSVNGTYLNGRRLVGVAELRNGDKIQLGLATVARVVVSMASDIGGSPASGSST